MRVAHRRISGVCDALACRGPSQLSRQLNTILFLEWSASCRSYITSYSCAELVPAFEFVYSLQRCAQFVDIEYSVEAERKHAHGWPVFRVVIHAMEWYDFIRGRRLRRGLSELLRKPWR